MHNVYMEHCRCLKRVWFGEYFDYEKNSPDFFLTEVSGIPFGLMGEMLQDGGNPWRGMIYGMTDRLPWAGDPRPIWKAWDDFGIADSRMIGYWTPESPVTTGRSDVLATSYVKKGRTLVALASWAKDTTRVRLNIDWKALGLDSVSAHITAAEIRDFQPAATFAAGDSIPVPSGKGWLLTIGP